MGDGLSEGAGRRMGVVGTVLRATAFRWVWGGGSRGAQGVGEGLRGAQGVGEESKGAQGVWEGLRGVQGGGGGGWGRAIDGCQDMFVGWERVHR